MAGNRASALKSSATNREKYGEDFYKIIGAKGGRNGNTGGFASEKLDANGMNGRERARVVGVKGGRKSKRGVRNV